MDRHGLDHAHNDQEVEPWVAQRQTREQETRVPGGFDQSAELPESEQEAQEVENLVTAETEWHEYAYAALPNPKDDDHPTYEQTLTRWDSDQWSKARDTEMASLDKMDTFDLVDRPKGAHVLDSRWVH